MTLGANARAKREVLQEYFSIGDVCALTGLKAHVLRYWETQFRALSPAKNRSGNRVYARREVELVLLVKHLLYTEKYTVDGARQKLDDHRRSGALRGAARAALRRETMVDLERELAAIVDVLEGRRPPTTPAEIAELAVEVLAGEVLGVELLGVEVLGVEVLGVEVLGVEVLGVEVLAVDAAPRVRSETDVPPGDGPAA